MNMMVLYIVENMSVVPVNATNPPFEMLKLIKKLR
jgi:hypothetical protein